MEVNFSGNPTEPVKTHKAAKVVAGAAAVAGVAAGTIYALKKGGLDVFEGISKQNGKNVFSKTVNAIKSGDNWKKLGNHFKDGFVSIKDSVVGFAKNHLPKAAKAAEEVAENVAENVA